MPRVYVEVAGTPESRERGLMFRERLASNSGMLFQFPSPRRLSFWMKDTKIPLNLAYLDKDRRIAEIHELHPMSLRSVPGSREYAAALEVNRGWFERVGADVGTRLVLAQEAVPGPGEPQPPPPPAQPPAAQQGQRPAPEVAMIMAIRDVVPLANKFKLSIVFDYEYPEGNVNSYVLIPLQEYIIKPGRTRGDLLCGPCVHSDGEFRNFVIEDIVDYELHEFFGPNSGRRVFATPKGLVPEPASPEAMPQATGEPAVAIATAYGRLLKRAQGEQLMMGEYWDALRVKRGRGMTEGRAILEYLSENSQKNSPWRNGRRPKG